MAEIREVEDGQLKESEQPKEMSTPNTIEGAPPEMLEKAVGQVMGLENESEYNRYSDKVKTLLDYAKAQTDDHSPENIKWAIRSLELKLGTPPLAEKRISFVARYAHLMREKSQIEKEMEEYEQRI